MFVAIIFCFCNVFQVRKGSIVLFFKLSEVNLGRVATRRKYFGGSKIIFWKFELIAHRMKQHPISFNLGWKRGLDDQTKAQRQGDFTNIINKKIYYLIIFIWTWRKYNLHHHLSLVLEWQKLRGKKRKKVDNKVKAWHKWKELTHILKCTQTKWIVCGSQGESFPKLPIKLKVLKGFDYLDFGIKFEKSKHD
jgi:hypothetical protein